MTLVTGLDMMDAQFKGHGWGVVYVLAGGDGTICNTTADISKSPYGGLPETSRGTQWQPTIDQLVASAIHKDEPYKSLETGILKYTGINMGTASLNLAHLGPNMPLAPERDPVKLFNTLFGMGTPMGLPIEISNQLRRSVLDAVLADAKRLQIDPGFGGLEAHRRSHGERPFARDAHSDERRGPAPHADVPGSDDSDRESREPGPGEGHRHEPGHEQADCGGAVLQHDPRLLALVVRRARRQPLSDHPARYRAPLADP